MSNTTPTELIYAVGDVHGEYGLLVLLLKKISEHVAGRPYMLIFLGDLVDRGPDSDLVVTQIKALCEAMPDRVLCLKGNHESLMVEGMKFELGLGGSRSAQNMWMGNGGVETLRSYIGKQALLGQHLKWMDSLPVRVETDHHIFVHAGLDSRKPVDQQDDMTVMWIRDWWDAEYDFGKHVVYGHCVSRQPKLREFSTGLDTGSCFYGVLSAGVFDPHVNSGPIEVLKATR